MFEFRRGVERVGVDDRETRAQRPEHRNGVLQDIRQHDREAIAALEACDMLQPRRKITRSAVEVAIGELSAHLDERGPLRKLHETVLGHVLERWQDARIDVRGHARQIGLKPDPFHDQCLSSGSRDGQTVSSTWGSPDASGCSPSACISPGCGATPASRNGTNGSRNCWASWEYRSAKPFPY